MITIGEAARASGQLLGGSNAETRNAALRAVSHALRTRASEIVAANALDLSAASAASLGDAVVKRLVLDAPKLESVIQGVEDVLALPDPLGAVSLARELAPGLELRRLSCPIGVICIIFESRPEAVVQITSLALKSGNAVILKGGKEAAASNSILVDVIRGALQSLPEPHRAAVPVDAVQLVSTREDIADLLKLDQHIDLVIPRGSNQLVRSIKAATRIPVLGHADGICHVYIDAGADIKKAVPIVVDSKTQYPAACNAAETLLVHIDALQTHFPSIASALLASGVSLACDASTIAIALEARARLLASTGAAPEVSIASEADFNTEWLSLKISIAVVPSTTAAIEWINKHGSHHTDAIVTEDASAARFFQANVDSAGVYHNASTRFADGHRYGFGAEVGISTNRIHARGPVGLEGLLTYKYSLTGAGHVVGQFSAQKGAATVVIAGQELPALSFTHRDL